jgi:hypothetical protein
MVKAAAERANVFLARRNAVVDGATLEHVAAVWELLATAARDASALYKELLLSDAPDTAKAGIAALQKGLDSCSCPPTNRHRRHRRPTCDEAASTLSSICNDVYKFQAVLTFCKESGRPSDPPTLHGAVCAYRAKHALLWEYLKNVHVSVDYHTPGLLSDMHLCMIRWVNWCNGGVFDQTIWERVCTFTE